MNKVILMGRLTRDPDVRYSQTGSQPLAVARFSIAVDRRFKRQNDEVTTDFFNCTAFGKQGEFVEKYLHQGTKVVVSGRIQNDNYTNREGQKVYSVQIITEDIEFAESKAAASANYNGGQQASFDQPMSRPEPSSAINDGFMNIPDGVDDELPFA